MPENNPLPDDMRVSEYLYLRGRLKEVPRRTLGPRIDEVLELSDLKRVRHKIIGQLSKGYRQRVGIAEAILAEPPVIIMDEPTIGLDPHQILIVRDLIASLRGRMTVLISSHILPEIEMTCDRVLIINQGRVVAQGTPADLRHEILGDSRYQLQLAGDTDALPALLTRLEPTLQIAERSEPDAAGFRTFTVSTHHHGELGERLLQALLAGGFRVRALARLNPSLEDVFLAATRRSWDAVASRQAPPPPHEAFLHAPQPRNPDVARQPEHLHRGDGVSRVHGVHFCRNPGKLQHGTAGRLAGPGLLPAVLAPGVFHGAASDHEVPRRRAAPGHHRNPADDPGDDDGGRPGQVRRRVLPVPRAVGLDRRTFLHPAQVRG
jgi:ABC-2 type transport system ATP-binding protein